MRLRLLPAFLLLAAPVFPAAASSEGGSPPYLLVVHGGSGVPADLSEDLREEYRQALTAALQAGYDKIANGGSSLDAVEAAIVIMEDSPLFNAGRGAVFTHEGRNELDASIMSGRDLEAGAVAGVTTLRNPIQGARAVMEQSPHVMMAGPGAELFAERAGLEKVDPGFFWTQRRWDALQRALEREERSDEQSHLDPVEGDTRPGTVGAAARDRSGNLAAGTSTGGMNNKRHGRIGDSPVIGAGTYADNSTVAVSSTGWGEKFIRTAAAFNVHAMMAYQEKPVAEAAAAALDQIAEIDGYGGIIAIDKEGNVAMPYTTRGMFRGAVTESGEIEVYIYQERARAPE